MKRIWIAVVVRDSFSPAEVNSARENGDWSGFIDTDKDKAVRKALRFAQKWSGQHRIAAGEIKMRDVEYRVLVGQLISEAQIPVEFKEIA